MANPFVHVELNTTDVDKAKDFYTQLFDWELEDMAMGPSDRGEDNKMRVDTRASNKPAPRAVAGMGFG